MSVFLRWGIFGILAVAALVYAYNASKRMAEKHTARDAPAAVLTPPTESREAEAVPEPERQVASAPASTPPHCKAELVVAQRALEARRQGDPLDRLLRIQEIAWQEPPARRRRLEEVATRWYQFEGEEPIPEALSIRVISDCVHFSPAP
ncbi:MAG TPA: hypothetical protein VFS58_00315 [Steroidobacteraceae bacterium]|nr:hypothetical protein [Steroidobacteraceae bacterium]